MIGGRRWPAAARIPPLVSSAHCKQVVLRMSREHSCNDSLSRTKSGNAHRKNELIIVSVSA